MRSCQVATVSTMHEGCHKYTYTIQVRSVRARHTAHGGIEERSHPGGMTLRVCPLVVVLYEGVRKATLRAWRLAGILPP